MGLPQGDQLSVGVIAAKGTAEQARAYLDDFLSRLRLRDVAPAVSSGHLTRCRTEDAPLIPGPGAGRRRRGRAA